MIDCDILLAAFMTYCRLLFAGFISDCRLLLVAFMIDCRSLLVAFMIDCQKACRRLYPIKRQAYLYRGPFSHRARQSAEPAY